MVDFPSRLKNLALAFLADDLEGRQVPGFGFHRHPHFGAAGGHTHGIHAAAHASHRPEVGDPGKEAFTPTAPQNFVNTCQAKHGLSASFRLRAMDACAVAVSAQSGGTRIEFTQSRQIARAHNHVAISFEGQHDTPEGNASHEAAGAVDGVDNPAAPAARFAFRAFLPQQAVVGKGLFQKFRDQPLVGAVG